MGCGSAVGRPASTCAQGVRSHTKPYVIEVTTDEFANESNDIGID